MQECIPPPKPSSKQSSSSNSNNTSTTLDYHYKTLEVIFEPWINQYNGFHFDLIYHAGSKLTNILIAIIESNLYFITFQDPNKNSKM